MTGDDRLLADLGAAVTEAARVPESFRAAGRAAFAWRSVDAELATITEPAAALMRGSERVWTLRAGDVTIELEATEDALVGQVAPPGPGSIELTTRDGGTGTALTAPVDELGWFALRPLPAGLFRLRLTRSIGSPVVTEWLTL
ncbi:hypothetical protein Dvina_03390 [Dactylosporangium vinaceum]|uniref:Uncharacterized protein n=1 Tax=Dactylosporangium vinaceum TaxID=53362 RepID=A0ABV5M0W2_9ACTN|nr:hypothetical protein [Dactylosporangium vinaceum]UAB97248.1 hypothetical protein Dvina_03390 [Dactylosporangium vinaceum]